MDQPVRRIVHLDMDAFYASIEQRDRPELRGRPVAVGGSPDQRGVVCAASYEARRFGVRSAIAMARATRLCPQLLVVPPDFPRYRAVSAQVFEIFRRVTPLVEPLSLDEAYLDVTENHWGEALASRVARHIKAAIREEVGLTASAGVAPNKFLAKVASGWRKPDGLTVVSPERVDAFLQKLPVEALWGVGPVTARKLHGLGINRLVDVRTADPASLQETLGSQTDWLRQLAWGRDPRPVEPDRPRKSVGSENTFARDLRRMDEVAGELVPLAERCATWLRRHGRLAGTVTIKVRYGDFTTVTRSISRSPPFAEAEAIRAEAVRLLERTEAGRRPIRLLGVSLHNLTDEPHGPAPGRPQPLWLPFVGAASDRT